MTIQGSGRSWKRAGAGCGEGGVLAGRAQSPACLLCHEFAATVFTRGCTPGSGGQVCLYKVLQEVLQEGTVHLPCPLRPAGPPWSMRRPPGTRRGTGTLWSRAGLTTLSAWSRDRHAAAFAPLGAQSQGFAPRPARRALPSAHPLRVPDPHPSARWARACGAASAQSAGRRGG